MAKYVILIAGNICAGKTEFVKYLEAQQHAFRPELREGEKLTIVPEFIDPVGLENFYHDRKRHTNQFELTCLNGRINRYQKAQRSSDLYIFDRGMIEGAETFCKNSFLEGYLSHADYENYLRTVKKALDELDRTEQQRWLEQLVVYFRMEEPRILQQRQQQRATKGEIIPLEYLQRLNERYEELFQRLEAVYTGYGVKAPKVICVDASINFHEDKGYHQRTLEEIVTVLHNEGLPEQQ